jgi:hypothetical protein
MPEEARMELLLVICLVFVTIFALVQRKLLRALTSDYEVLTFDRKEIIAADLKTSTILLLLHEAIRRKLLSETELTELFFKTVTGGPR